MLNIFQFENFKKIFFEFFIANFFAIFLVVDYIYMDSNSSNSDIKFKIVYFNCLAITFFVFLKFYLSHIKTIVVGFIGLGIYFFVYWSMLSTFSFNIQCIIFSFLMLGSLVWIIFFKDRENNSSILSFYLNIILSLLISFFISLLLFSGLELIIFALRKLFMLNIDKKIDFYLALIIFTIIGLNIFLNYLIESKNREKNTISPTIKIILKSILSFLSILISFVIIFYFVKINLARELPNGEIVSFGFFYLITLLVTNIFLITFEIYRKLSKFFWFCIFIWSIIMLIAIIIRIEQYGLTDNRILTFAWIIWFLAISIYFFVRNSSKIFYIFYTFSLISFFIFIFKPFLIYTLQSKKFDELIKVNEPINNNTDINVRVEITSILNYLGEHYSYDFLNKRILLKEDFLTCSNENYRIFTACATKKLGFDAINNKTTNPFIEHTFIQSKPYNDSLGIEISGYDYLVKLNNYSNEQNNQKNELNFTVKIDKSNIVFKNLKEKKFLNLEITNIERQLNILANKKDTTNLIEKKKLIFLINNDDIKCKFYVDTVKLNKNNEIENISGIILIKFKRNFLN